MVDTRRELEEIFCIREALEGYAARFAAERMTDDELRTLEDLMERSIGAVHDDEWVKLNDEFHDLVAVASRVPRLIEMIREFREYSANAVVVRLYDRDAFRESVEEHRRILGALRDRDVARAETVVREHLRSAYRKMIATGGGT